VSQLAESQDYVELKPFVSIVIVDFPIKSLAHRKKFYTDFYIHSCEDDITLFEDFQIRIIELPKLAEYVEETKLYTWAKFIAADDTEAKKAMAENNAVLRNAIDFMQGLNADKIARQYYDAQIKKARDIRAEKAFVYNQGYTEAEKKLSDVINAQAARIAELEAKLGLQF
jgi:predicted transposase/invertase (TIGR01784 family)